VRPPLYPTNFPNLRATTKRPRPETLYYGDFRVNGTRYRPPLGADKDAAINRLRLLMAARVAEQVRPVYAGGRRLSDAQQAHLATTRDGLRPKSLAACEQGDRNALGGLGDQLLCELSANEVEAWLLERWRTVAPATANKDLVRLSQVLGWAVKQGWIASNPCEAIKARRIPEGRVRYLSGAEEERLRAVCSQAQWDRIEFAWRTGLRESEQLGLHRAQLVGGQIRLEGEGTKSHRRRAIPISPEVAAILERQPATGLVWPSPRGKVWTLSNFRKRFWLPLFEAAGLEDFLWHDLRHTFCSRLAMRGAPMVDICALAGHRDLRTTMKYSHLSPEHLATTIRLL
jgi:integrase